jgi:hypothetical protein
MTSGIYSHSQNKKEDKKGHESMKKLLSILLVLTLALSLVCSAGIAAYADDDPTAPVTDGAPPALPSGTGGGQNGNTDPNAGNTDPNAGNTDPNAGNTDPNAGNTDPNAGNTDPNAGNTDPNAGNTDPNAGNTDPNAGNTDPNAGNTDPNAVPDDIPEDDPTVDPTKKPADEGSNGASGEPTQATANRNELVAAVASIVGDAEDADAQLNTAVLTPSAAEQEQIKAAAKAQLGSALDGLEFGAFLDITLTAIANGTKISVDKADKAVSVSFTIPSNVQGKDSYKILRIHNDTYTLLDVTVSGNTVTFETDQFSTYVLLYKASASQAPAGSAPAGSAPAGGSSKPSGSAPNAKSGGGASGEPGSPQTGYSTLGWAASAVVTLLGGVMAIVPKKRLF